MIVTIDASISANEDRINQLLKELGDVDGKNQLVFAVSPLLFIATSWKWEVERTNKKNTTRLDLFAKGVCRDASYVDDGKDSNRSIILVDFLRKSKKRRHWRSKTKFSSNPFLIVSIKSRLSIARSLSYAKKSIRSLWIVLCFTLTSHKLPRCNKSTVRRRKNSSHFENLSEVQKRGKMSSRWNCRNANTIIAF